ncbi:hypothetical protein BH23CHL7_BH23CHL7_05090 [soil metagenome]
MNVRRMVGASAALAIALSVSTFGVALADLPASNKNARFVTLQCENGTFQTVIGAATQFLLLDRTATYVVTSATVDGQLAFTVPGRLDKGNQVQCTFSLSGRTIEVTGFFTPAR